MAAWPWFSATMSPFSISVATAAKGTGNASMGFDRYRLKNCARRSPFIKPRPKPPSKARTGSKSNNTLQSSPSAAPSISATVMPEAHNAPTMAPALLPTTRSGRRPSRSSTRNTPRCAKPRAAPPDKTNAQACCVPAGGAVKPGSSRGLTAGKAPSTRAVAQPAIHGVAALATESVTKILRWMAMPRPALWLTAVPPDRGGSRCRWHSGGFMA